MPVSAATTAVSQKHRTALIITSNQDILHLIAAILKLENYRLIDSKDEAEGFTLAKTVNPDVIIFLVNREQEDTDFCQRLRQDTQLSRTPLVVLTTSGDSQAYTRLFSNGCDQILPVPFKCKALLAATEEASKRSQNRDSSLIRVLYRSGYSAFVSPSQLNQLLRDKELLCFQRRDGVATIGRDPIRYFVRANYSGPERRLPSTLSSEE